MGLQRGRALLIKWRSRDCPVCIGSHGQATVREVGQEAKSPGRRLDRFLAREGRV